MDGASDISPCIREHSAGGPRRGNRQKMGCCRDEPLYGVGNVYHQSFWPEREAQMADYCRKLAHGLHEEGDKQCVGRGSSPPDVSPEIFARSYQIAGCKTLLFKCSVLVKCVFRAKTSGFLSNSSSIRPVSPQLRRPGDARERRPRGGRPVAAGCSAEVFARSYQMTRRNTLLFKCSIPAKYFLRAKMSGFLSN
jgi:hypothetical protein